MLEELAIRGLGAIEAVRLPLGPGFTVFTGETGAGKTLVLTGLGLLFGARAAGEHKERVTVDGRLRLDPAAEAVARSRAAGADLDEDGTLLLSRAVAADGRSRCWAGGRPVPVSVLAEIGEDVLAVHGQSDQQRLLRPAEQRRALDRYGHVPWETYRECYRRWRALRLESEELARAEQDRQRERELLRFGLERISAVNPEAGEDMRLRGEVERLDHAEQLQAAAEQALEALSGAGDPEAAQGGPAALELLTAAGRLLRSAGAHDPRLAGLAERIGALCAEGQDCAGELASYLAEVDTDPAALEAVQQRLSVLGELQRRYGPALAEVLDWATAASARLAELDAQEDRGVEVFRQLSLAREELAAHAGRLSAARAGAAERFAEAVSGELAALAMGRARIVAGVSQREDADGLEVDGRRLAFGPHGVDEVEILLSTAPADPGRPLQRGASGGELSRVMLAIEAVLADTDPVPVLVFDEVDAGVGGAAAVEVGRRLSRLARDHQVLCVTHLAQVAAFADAHVLVQRTDEGDHVRTRVETLDPGARTVELSRMLAGMSGSELARGHAEELLALAARFRAG